MAHDILDRFLRDPFDSGIYDGIDWYLKDKAGGLKQEKNFRAVMPGVDVPMAGLRLAAYDLLKKHTWKTPARMRSDRVWSHLQRLKWYSEGADILRPWDYDIPKDEIWAVPPPEVLGLWWGSKKGRWGIATRRGARVLRIRVDWMDRFTRI